MISNNGWELHGQEKQKTDRSGEIWWRATSSSGGTQPRYKVQGTKTKEKSTAVDYLRFSIQYTNTL